MLCARPESVRRARAVVAALAALLALGVGGAAEADHAAQHWGARTITIRDEVGLPQARRAIEDAAAAWLPIGVDIVVEEGDGRGCDDPAHGEISVCGDDSTTTWGTTRIWLAHRHISRAAVRLNLDLVGERLQAVACHEIGHALGLRHRDAGETCMAESPTATRPDRHDLDAGREAHDHEHAAPRCQAPHLVRVGDSCFFRTP